LCPDCHCHVSVLIADEAMLSRAIIGRSAQSTIGRSASASQQRLLTSVGRNSFGGRCLRIESRVRCGLIRPGPSNYGVALQPKQSPICVRSSSSSGQAEPQAALLGVKIAAGVGGFLACDYVVKVGMDAAGLDRYLPSQIGCMLGSFMGMTSISLVSPGAAACLQAALLPAVGWVGKWLPIFLVPVQVMLPTISLPGGAEELGKLLLLLGVGWLSSVVVTARLVHLGQRFLPVAIEAAAPAKAAAAQTLSLRFPKACAYIFALTMPLGILGECEFAFGGNPDATFDLCHTPQTLRGISFVALGAGSYALALRSGLPGHLSFVVSGASVIAGVAMSAYALGETYTTVAKRDYLTGSSKPFSDRTPGDVLLWFLGPALAATGVQIFQYRARIALYGPVLLGTCAVMSLANILAMACVGPMLNISPEALLASFVRCVTIPMAVPTYGTLCKTDNVEGNVALVALCAGVSGFLGFGLSKMVLSSALCAAPIANPVVRGIATGTSAHVLGAATFAATEPEAFVWGMLSMAAAGVCSSAWICACPPIRDLVIGLARRTQATDSVGREKVEEANVEATMPQDSTLARSHAVRLAAKGLV